MTSLLPQTEPAPMEMVEAASYDPNEPCLNIREQVQYLPEGATRVQFISFRRGGRIMFYRDHLGPALDYGGSFFPTIFGDGLGSFTEKSIASVKAEVEQKRNGYIAFMKANPLDPVTVPVPTEPYEGQDYPISGGGEVYLPMEHPLVEAIPHVYA